MLQTATQESFFSLEVYGNVLLQRCTSEGVLPRRLAPHPPACLRMDQDQSQHNADGGALRSPGDGVETPLRPPSAQTAARSQGDVVVQNAAQQGASWVAADCQVCLRGLQLQEQSLANKGCLVSHQHHRVQCCHHHHHQHHRKPRDQEPQGKVQQQQQLQEKKQLQEMFPHRKFSLDFIPRSAAQPGVAASPGCGCGASGCDHGAAGCDCGLPACKHGTVGCSGGLQGCDGGSPSCDRGVTVWSPGYVERVSGCRGAGVGDGGGPPGGGGGALCLPEGKCGALVVAQRGFPRGQAVAPVGEPLQHQQQQQQQQHQQQQQQQLQMLQQSPSPPRYQHLHNIPPRLKPGPSVGPAGPVALVSPNRPAQLTDPRPGFRRGDGGGPEALGGTAPHHQALTASSPSSSVAVRVPSELTCTCPNLNNNGGVAERRVASVEDMDRRGAPPEGGGGPKSWNRFRREESSIFPSIAAKTRFFASKCQREDENANPSGYRSYRRSISLGQILNSDGSFGSPGGGGGGGGVGIPGGGGGGGGRGVGVGHPYLPGSPGTSPIEVGGGRELSDFEKENLLFLKDLDNSYHRPLSDDLDNSYHRPLSHSLSNTSLGSTFSEDSLTEDSTPRGGSPYPGRREFPRTTYSPSKTVVDPRILRSVSREEPESESSDRESLRGSRKISLPIIRRTEHRSHSSGPSSLPDSHGAWWNSGHVRETLDRAPSTNQNRSFENARRLFTNRSLSSPGEVSSRPSEKLPSVSNVTEVGRRRWVRTSSSAASPSIVDSITNNNNNNNNIRSNNNNNNSKKTNSKKTSNCEFRNISNGNTINNNIKDAATRSLAHLTEATPAAGKTAAPPADLPCTAATAAASTAGGPPAANSSSSSSTPHKSFPSSSTPTTPSTTPGDTSSLTPPSSSTSNAIAAASGASPSGTTVPAAVCGAKNGEGEDETGTASTLADSSSGGSSGSSSSSGSSGSSTKRPQGQPMAFTIDLGDETGGASSDNNKKLDISDSIRKWAPRHRRNLSLTKVDENKVVENFFDENGNSRPKRRRTISRLDKVEEKVGKPPMGRPRSGTVGTAGLPGAAGARRGGYHSEGYFSSDQDDEAPRNRELKSPRSPRTPELRSPLSQTRGQVQRSPSQDSSKGVNLRKQGGKPEGRSCCKDGKKPTVAQVTGKAKTEKVCKQEEHNAAEEDADNVSETGTYTIEKDSSSPEVEQARQDIDRVFGVSGTESDADVALLARGTITATSVAAAIPSSTTVTSTAGVIHSSDETWNGTAESDKFKGPPSLSRSSPNWIQQWAAQVAEQTKSSTDKTAMAALGSPRGSKPPLASPTLRGLSTSQESSESRPRRILPTPPVHSAPYTLPSPSHSSPFTLPSPRGQEPSDQESPTKAGRARMDLAKTSPAGYRGSSFESHDSGGDSDLDTSTSYPISGTDERLSKVLKAKLKLGSSGDEGTKVSPVVASPRKLDPLALDTRLKMTSHFKRERSIMSDGGYEMYSSRREDHGLQSDSSSETSEPIKDARKASDNNPPLKFNRAFSLRRARLGCDDSSPSPQTPTAPDKKKKPVRPNSAGTIGTSSRRTPTGVARNEAKSTSQTNKGSAAESFLRADGGRFSLRVPKSGSTATVSKSPSRATSKKEQSAAGRRGAPRSNSTLSAKEIDFQNWKRRKNYDPMKAAAEGRKKQGDKKTEKSGSTPPNVNVTTSDARSPSPPGSLLRSASFHGTVGLGMSAAKWNRRPNHLNTSEDEAPLSLEEDHLAAPHASPLRRSPTSPHQMASPISASPAHHALNARARRSSYAHSEDGEGHHGTISRKHPFIALQASLDESGSEGKVSPMGTSRGPSSTSGRSKAKMEALDNLVISTIHSLSVKVRTTSENLLQKLKSQYDEEGDRAALLEAVLSHLSEGDQSLSASQSRSTSRELAGILQNLKKIGNALEVIDRVLILEDDDDLDDDDLEGTGAGDWSDRDY